MRRGWTSDGPWKTVRNGFLLPARVVMAVFRGKLLAAIRQAFARGALGLPEPMRPQQFINLVNRLGHPTKTRWSVRIMERYRHGAGVVTYVARYLRGGPIKNAAMQSGRPSISIHGIFASPSGATAIGTATAPPPPAMLCQQLVPILPKRPGTSLSCNPASLCLDLQGLQIGMLSLPSSGSLLAACKAAQLALWRGWGWLPVARGGAGGVLGGSGE